MNAVRRLTFSRAAYAAVLAILLGCVTAVSLADGSTTHDLGTWVRTVSSLISAQGNWCC